MQKRQKKLQVLLKQKKIEAFLFTDPISIEYLTKFSPSFGKLYVLPKSVFLFVDGRYLEEAKKIAECSVLPLEKEKEYLKKLPKKIVLDEETTTLSLYKKFKKEFPKLNFAYRESPLQSLRMIKDENELNKMREAAKITYKAYGYLSSLLKKGISEKELALSFEIFIRKEGAEKTSFDPIIAFGSNSAIPHHEASDRKLKENEVVLMDLGVVYQGYCSDMTRCLFFKKPNPKIKHLYNIILECKKAAFHLCKPGTKISKLDEAVRSIMKSYDVEELFIHGLGHGVGLEIHEKPSLKKTSLDRNLKLEPGMVITIEPGLYIPNLGGIRHEDTIVINEVSYENFYPNIQ